MTQTKFTCLFCDDVRRELGGKYSYMGVYQDSLIFKKFPGNLSTFHAIFKLKFNLNKCDCDTITFLLTNNDGFEHEVNQSLSEIRNEVKKNKELIKNNGFVSLVHVYKLQNLNFDKKTILESYAFLGDKKISGEKILIMEEKEKV